MRNVVTSVAIAAVIFSTTSVADAALIIFGGSWSDAGNAAILSDGTDPRPDVYFNDRFTNGPTYFDRMKMATEPSLKGGTNYAVGASQLVLHQEYGNQYSIQGQVMSYLDSVGGLVPMEDTLIVFVGSTDIGSLAQLGFSGTFTTVDDLIGALKSIVKMLLSAKARNIILVNQYDVGLSPFAIQLQNPPFAQLLRALSQDWNAQLTLYAAEIGAKVVDLFTLFDTIVADKASFGFNNVTGFFGFDLITEMVPQVQPEVPSKYLWFDQIHPTTEGHSVLADAFLSVLEKRFADPALALYNADTDLIVGLLGGSIDLCLFGGIGLTIVAVVGDKVRKVKFRLLNEKRGLILKNVEDVAPFSLGGDIGEDLLPVPALSKAGSYTLVVRPGPGEKKEYSFDVLSCP